MKLQMKKVISPEEWFHIIKTSFKSSDVKAAAVVFMFGLCLYVPMITQRLTCSDGTICGIFYRSHSDYDIEDIAGRYLLKYFAHFKSMFVFSWLAVVVGIACMSIGAILICKVLKIDSVIKILIVGLLIQVSPCFIETFSYYFAADAYVISFLLVTLAVYLLHEKKTFLRAFVASLLMFVSMTFYQAYIFIAVVLFLYILIRDLLDEAKDWKQIGRGLLWQIGSGIVAFAVYVLANKVFKMVGLIFYQESRFKFSEIFSLEVLPKAIANAYRHFYEYFFTMNFINNEWKARNVVNAVILLLCIVLLILNISKTKKAYSYKIATIVVLAILPMAFMGISILNWQEGTPRIMMLPTVCLFYIGAWALWNRTIKKYQNTIIHFCGWGLYAVTGYLLIIMTVYLGIYQVCMQYYADKTDSMAQRIITRIEQEYPETVAGSPVFICGDVDEGNYPQDYWIT